MHGLFDLKWSYVPLKIKIAEKLHRVMLSDL